MSFGAEPVVEDVCLAVKRQVEAQRQSALKERARLLPSPSAATTADTGKKAAAGGTASGMSPAVMTQQALRHLRAGLEGSPLLTPDDVRALAAQAHGHVKGFVGQATPAPPAGGRAPAIEQQEQQQQQAVDLAVTAHAFLGFALQAVAAAPPPVHAPSEGGEGQQEQQLLHVRSLGAARAAVRELVGAMPSFWGRLAELEGGASADGARSGGFRALVSAFCWAHARRLLLALLHWGGPAGEGPAAEGKEGGADGSASAAAWWLGLMAAGILRPLQVEAAWLRLPPQELRGAGPLAAAGVAASVLIRGHHQGAGAGKTESGGSSYHPLDFSRLRAVVCALDE